jgi:pimeloyl-ACP methyl ester carboxylesterase
MKKNILPSLRNISNNPFGYDLGIKIIESPDEHAGIMLCFHGYGADSNIVYGVQAARTVTDHLVGINFPDYSLSSRAYNPKTSSFGSINEIRPMLYMLKQLVVDNELSKINLYGFSAGGGAIVNLLAILNTSTHDAELLKIGITAEIKKKIIAALEQGKIILDCPLKSIDEIMDLRGPSYEFSILAERYKKNNMRPIDAIEKLKGLHLTIFLHFQNPDEILSNRDDQQFIDRLKAANSGPMYVTIGNDGGHNTIHKALWKKYRETK